MASATSTSSCAPRVLNACSMRAAASCSAGSSTLPLELLGVPQRQRLLELLVRLLDVAAVERAVRSCSSSHASSAARRGGTLGGVAR